MSDSVIVQFVGFEVKALVREYNFHVRQASSEIREFTLTIVNEAFNSRRVRLCLSKISKCLSAWELVFLHNSRRCSFFSRHSSQLCGRSSGRVLPSGSRTWLYAIKSACSTGLLESAQT